MRIRYGLAWLVVDVSAFLLGFLAFCVYVFVNDGDYGLVALCALVDAVICKLKTNDNRFYEFFGLIFIWATAYFCPTAQKLK